MTQKAEVSLRGAQATKQSNLYHNNRLFFIQYSLAMTFYFLKTAITKRVYFYVVLFFVYYTFNFFSHPHKLFIIKCAFKDAELSMNAKPFHHFKQSITAVVIRNIVSNNIKHTSFPPHPNPLPQGEREIMCYFVSYPIYFSSSPFITLARLST